MWVCQWPVISCITPARKPYVVTPPAPIFLTSLTDHNAQSARTPCLVTTVSLRIHQCVGGFLLNLSLFHFAAGEASHRSIPPQSGEVGILIH